MLDNLDTKTSANNHGKVWNTRRNHITWRLYVGLHITRSLRACPDLVVVPPRMELYLQFSSMLREIYGEYTDLVEPYGCDEAWLDVTGSTALKGDEKKIADEIRSRVKKELGITGSIGISWNKIFAKLGSDYKKPDAIT